MKLLKRLILVVVLGLALILTVFHFYLLDGLTGAFFSLGEKENTVYATGYTDSGFRRIRQGMSSNDVLSILGPPLAKYDLKNPHRVLWQYSKEIEDLSFSVRNVIFKDAFVCEVICEYYVD
jgi:hypothetical protein